MLAIYTLKPDHPEAQQICRCKLGYTTHLVLVGNIPLTMCLTCAEEISEPTTIPLRGVLPA